MMDIQKNLTLQEKQKFWAEQLPNFESKYWLPSHFEFLAFDMDQGNYTIKDDLDPSFEDDATEIWHRVNTGWAMWKKAINFTKAQVPESNALLSAAMDAVQKLGSGDFVLVPRVITDEWMAVYVDPVVAKYCKDYEDLPFSVEESELPEIRESHRLPIRNAHKRLMQVIEAQEQSHD